MDLNFIGIYTLVATMKTFALRFKPDQDLRQTLAAFTQKKTVKAGFILTAAGSLKQVIIRFADRNKATV